MHGKDIKILEMQAEVINSSFFIIFYRFLLSRKTEQSKQVIKSTCSRD